MIRESAGVPITNDSMSQYIHIMDTSCPPIGLALPCSLDLSSHCDHTILYRTKFVTSVPHTKLRSIPPQNTLAVNGNVLCGQYPGRVE